MKTQKKDLTLRLVETAVMIALAVILNDLLSIKWPFGGSITIMSALPMTIIAYRYGFR